MTKPLYKTTDENTGWTSIHAQIGDLAISLVPQAGCNVSSIRFRGTELLRQAPFVADLPGFRYGVPVLYPTPGRVSEGRFTHEGKTYTLPADDELGVLHGIACRSPWTLKESMVRSGESASIRCELVFRPGSDHFDAFPLPHTLELCMTLTANAVRWDYRVTNESSGGTLPFGFGLHPWFLYQGDRESTWLFLEASEQEVLNEGFGTGQRKPIPEAIRFPLCLAEAEMDDVFCVAPEHPATIRFRAADLALTLDASESFRWLVAYTPHNEPWLCVENWTSIPDAHNLHAAGHRETGLQFVQPGKSCRGWVRLRVENAD